MTSRTSFVRAGIHQIAPNGPRLSYLLHQPSSSVEGTARPRTTRAALIAHPFGRLGGRKEDHVVAAIAELLADEGYAVIRYDARGAGESEGSASWTGATEAEDYRQLVHDLVLPLLFPPETGSAPADSPPVEGELLLCGYSFGSLAASACPPPSPPPSHPHARLTTSYLLISYPLSVIWALTLFRSGPFTTALRETVERGDERVLAIFGDRDQFSAVEKLRKWAGELETVAEGSGNKTWQAVEIEGADHFWLDRAPKIELLETVRAWVHRKPATQL